MSEFVYYAFPTDPWWMPDKDTADAALAALTRLVPPGPASWRPYEAVRSADPQLVDADGNCADWYCPACGSALEADAWREALASESPIRLPGLRARLTCCGWEGSLNDVEFGTYGSGFARFVLEAPGPREPRLLAEEELAEIATALNHPVRQALAHY